MFERRDYRVEKIEGDYAFLKELSNDDRELKCVARALLPPEINEGTLLAYEMMEYRMI